jgi:hypothetical protein
MLAAAESSFKLTNGRYAPYIQRELDLLVLLRKWYDISGEVVELLVVVLLWGVIAHAEGLR